MTSRIKYNNPNVEDKLSLAYHYELVSDFKRVDPFKKSIQKICGNKRVLESGTGTGLLSILALKAGAKMVYSIEKDEKMVKIAQNNILKNDCQNCIKLVNKDSRDLSWDDIDKQSVDVIIAENLSTWLVTEPQISIMNHLNKFLNKDGIVIPGLIMNYLELTHSEYTFENILDIRSHFFQFTGIKAPLALSDKKLFSEIDPYKTNSTYIRKKINVDVNQSGILNSLRLTSPLKIYNDITFEMSDSLMPPVVVPLSEDILVANGDNVEISVEFEMNSTWENFKCHASLINSN